MLRSDLFLVIELSIFKSELLLLGGGVSLDPCCGPLGNLLNKKEQRLVLPTVFLGVNFSAAFGLLTRGYQSKPQRVFRFAQFGPKTWARKPTLPHLHLTGN